MVDQTTPIPQPDTVHTEPSQTPGSSPGASAVSAAEFSALKDRVGALEAFGKVLRQKLGRAIEEL